MGSSQQRTDTNFDNDNPRQRSNQWVRQQIKLRRERRLKRADYIVSSVCVAVCTLILMLFSHQLVHWFVLPLMLCGVVAGVDVVRWLRGRLDLFDPKGVIACVAFYGCFITPLLHVIWNRFGVNDDLPMSGDWRIWLGLMATLNAAGLLGYQFIHNLVFRYSRPSKFCWKINRNRFYFYFACALTSSAAAVFFFLWQMGGISGMVRSFEQNIEAYAGKGVLLVFAWPLAVLSFIFLIYIWTDRDRRIRRPLSLGILPLCVFGIGHFAIMGWYGTRAGTVWALFWMAGILHQKFQRLPRTIMALGLIFIIAFMYFYGFYKEQGREGFRVIQSPAEWFQPYRRDVKLLLLDDFARADVDAYILFNEIKYPDDYHYRWGLTYAGAFAILIPKNLWPHRPNFKVEAGTEATVGKAALSDSSRVYGIAGEALLNFGPMGVVPLFMIYGGLLGWYRRKLASWSSVDARMFLTPFFTMLFASAFVADTDNLLFNFVTEGIVIIPTIRMAIQRRRYIDSDADRHSRAPNKGVAIDGRKLRPTSRSNN
jgi:hypothetical protein